MVRSIFTLVHRAKEFIHTIMVNMWHSTKIVRVSRLREREPKPSGHGTCGIVRLGLIPQRLTNDFNVRTTSVVAESAKHGTGMLHNLRLLTAETGIEVALPTGSHCNVQKKLAWYSLDGIRLIWLVNPATRVSSSDRSQNHTELAEHIGQHCGGKLLR